MRRKLLFLVLIMLAANGFIMAQPEKSDDMISGDISGMYRDNITNKLRTEAMGNVNVEPLWGKCIGKGYVIGGGLNYSGNFDTYYDINGKKAWRDINHAVGPVIFTRYYTKLAEKFYLRYGTNIDYSVDLSRSLDFTNNTKTPIGVYNVFDIRFRLGLVIFPKPNIGIEFSYGEIGYSVNFDHVITHGTRSVNNEFIFKYGVDGLQISVLYFMKHGKKTKAANSNTF